MMDNTTPVIPEPSSVISALQILTSAKPEYDGSKPGSSAVFKLDEILLANTVKLENALKSDTGFEKLNERWIFDTVVVIPIECSSRQRFVLYCLRTLHLLQASLHESQENFIKTIVTGVKKTKPHEMTPDTLSFNEQKVVKGALQFVICLGICPNLLRGVGLPLELRSGFSALVNMVEDKDTMSECEKNVQLFHCIKVLMSCVNCPALGTMILTQHLVDILAALFQLTHLGNKQKHHEVRNEVKIDKAVESDSVQCGESKHIEKLSVEEKSLHDMSPAKMVDYVRSRFEENIATEVDEMKKEGHEKSKELKESNDYINTGDGSDVKLDEIDFMYCEKCLEDLLKKIYPPLLVKTLMLLQGGPKSKVQSCQNAPILPQAPVWLRQECSRRLMYIIMMPKGVQSVLRGMLDAPGMAKGMSEADDWRKCDAVSKVIACCPLKSLSVDEYYRKTAPQILELLHIKDKQVSRKFLRVACSTISNMANQQTSRTKKYLIEPMMKPLIKCLDTKGTDVTMAASDSTVVEESQFTQCLEDCHKVFVYGNVGNPQLVLCIQPVVLTLFKLFVFMKPGVSALKTACKELIVAFLKQADTQVTLTCLQLMAFEQTSFQNKTEFPRMHHYLKFVNGNDGGIMVQTNFNESSKESAQEVTVDCIVSLLKDLQNSSVPGEFLVFLLKELTQFIKIEVDEDESQGQASLGSQDNQALIDIEQRNQSKIDQFHRKLTLLNVLVAVCETIGPECISNAKHTLEFVKATLERGVQVCKRTEDAVFEVFENETLTMAMGLLTALLTGAFQLTDEDRQDMQELLPLLLEISSDHRESSVQEMATDIRIAIATHGAVWSELSKEKSQNFEEIAKKVKQEKEKVTPLTRKTAKKIEVLSEQHFPKKGAEKSYNTVVEAETVSGERDIQKNETNNNCNAYKTGRDDLSMRSDLTVAGDMKSELSNVETSAKTSNEIKEIGNKVNGENVNLELDLAFKELCDTLIPVRGHGLIRLTHLVQKRDPEVKDRRETVLKIFVENLDHGDSYIYLSAVNGLAAMCDMYPDLVVPNVCTQFADFDNLKGQQGKKRSAELRMKLGEVMVKASRCLGDTIAGYRDLLLSSVLTGVRDEEAFVRASSLSNLGEICKLLKFSLGNIIQEVFECCSSTLKHDKDVEVRKAAAQALTLLIQGSGPQIFKILDSVLKDLYRLLKHVMRTEKEDGVKLHVHLALNELNDLMKEQLFPNQKLEKKIKVLDFD